MPRIAAGLLTAPVLLAALAAAGRAAEAPPADRERIRSLVQDLGSADQKARSKARTALYKMGSPAVPFLVEALEGGKLELRRYAAWILGADIERAAKAAVPALIRALEDPDAKLRRWAAHSLGMITGEDGYRMLRKRYGLPPGETGKASGEAVPALIKALGDSDRFVRQAAAEALAAISPAAKDAVPALLAALDDPQGLVRSAAARALESIGPDPETTMPALVKALGDEDRGVRLYAAGALGGMGPDAKDAAPALVRALATMHHRKWIGAYNALVNIGPSAIPPLIEALGDDSDQVRWYAIEQLSRFGSAAKEAVPALEKLAAASKGNIFHSPFSALGSIGADAVAALVRLLDHADPEIRSSAAGALIGIGPEASVAVPALEEALTDASWGVRQRACLALGRLGEAAKSAAAALEKALGDENPRVRVCATEAYWRVTGNAEKVVPALVRALTEDGGGVESTAARALGEIGLAAAASVPALTSLLKQADTLTAWEAAAEALGKIGPAAKASVPTLEAAFQKDDDSRFYRFVVRARAAEAIWRITGNTEEATGRLMSIAKSGEESLRQQRAAQIAVGVLGEMGPAAKEAVPVLAGLLHKPEDYNFNRAAAEALGRIGPDAKEAVPALERALDAYRRDVRMTAAEALWRITGRADKALPVLLGIAGGKGWDYRRLACRRAVEVIGTFGPAAKDALSVLRELLEDEDPDIRRAAAEAISKTR